MHKPGLQWTNICLVTYHQPAGIIPTMSGFPCPLKDAPWLLFSQLNKPFITSLNIPSPPTDTTLNEREREREKKKSTTSSTTKVRL